VSTLELFLRFAISMVVVVGLIGVAGRLLRRRTMKMGGAWGRREVPFQIVHRQSLGKGMSLVLVRSERRLLLVGATPSSVRLVAELDPEDIAIGREGERGAESTSPVASILPFGLLREQRDGGRRLLSQALAGHSSEPLARSRNDASVSDAVGGGVDAAGMQRSTPATTPGRWMAQEGRASPPALAWMAKLDQLRERTIRRA